MAAEPLQAVPALLLLKISTGSANPWDYERHRLRSPSPWFENRPWSRLPST